MQNLLKKISRRVNGFIFTLIFTGIILVILAFLIVWTEFVLRLVVGLFILIVAYIFFYGAYKVWWLKREIEKHFKL